MLVSSLISASRSMIWAWMVTSRAVVGSSAMSSFGLQESAMAIMARCRIPPENSWGYWSARSSGLGMFTSFRYLMASAFASDEESFLWCLMASTICFPTFMVGFRQVMGSWKIMATSLPRIFCISFSDALTMSCSPSRTSPAGMRAGGMGFSLMMVWAVTLLPQPDSPTTASTSPSSREKVTPRTACTTPAYVSKDTCRSLISNTLLICCYLLRRGSNASRRPSPNRLKENMVRLMHSAGMMSWEG